MHKKTNRWKSQERTCKRSKYELYKADRAFRVLRKCNKLLVQPTEEAELLHNICRIIVEAGGYHSAWIGFADEDGDKIVRPLARAGYEKRNPEITKITWANNECGRSPTGKAIRRCKPIIMKNIAEVPEYAPWCAEATKHGYTSSIVLPLIAHNHAFGALNIYAEEPDAFDAEETELLEELAESLAYGIIAIRTRTKLKQTEELLQCCEKKYRILAENVLDGIYILSPEGFEYINPAFERICGYKAKELLSKDFNFLDLIHPEDRKIILERKEAREKGKRAFS
ncbi:MAG: GAF domain-containing protein [Candidatus Aminicenantales bacterium]